MKPTIDRSTLEAIFDSMWSAEKLSNSDELREKFVFHMQDALPDIVKLADVINSSDCQSVEELEKHLYDLFLHTVPHLMAAGQIYDTVPETFPEQNGVHRLEATEPSPTSTR